MKRIALLSAWAAVGVALLLASCQTATTSSSAPPAPVQNFAVDPAETPAPALPSVGSYYVDNYKTNQNPTATTYNTPAANAALNLLAKFSDLWTSGGSGSSAANPSGYATAYKNGTVKNGAVLSANIQYVATVTAARTAAQADAAYYDDRRGKTFSTITGFGPLAAAVYTGTNITTTITSIPADAVSVTYSEGGNDYSSPNITAANGLYDVINLIGKVRTSGASGNPSKFYFNYPRPWRLANDSTLTEGAATDGPYYANSANLASLTSPFYFPVYAGSTVSVVPALKPIRSTTPATDGGFPSGHTAESYNTGLLMAYSVPERFQELVTRASDMGENRILAGQHSPLDVMGARMFATALTAAGLNDSANSGYKTTAFATAHTYLKAQTGATDATLYTVAHTGDTSAYADWATNKANYLARLTYGLPKVGSSGVPAVVPKGAEVLLETRLPYLSAAQRREVLRTTAIDSGYPLLDDSEGWGRLNLFNAADGYGSLAGTTYVRMDASLVASTQNHFYAFDTWRNDIGGAGRLVKQGTGTLVLTGTNAYAGGTRVEEGVLTARTASALGSSDVLVSGGTLEAGAPAAVKVAGRLTVSSQGTLKVDLGTAPAGQLAVTGPVALGGTLVADFAVAPVAGTSYQVLTAGGLTGTFSTIVVTVNGVASATVPTPTYSSGGLVLNF